TDFGSFFDACLDRSFEDGFAPERNDIGCCVHEVSPYSDNAPDESCTAPATTEVGMTDLVQASLYGGGVDEIASEACESCSDVCIWIVGKRVPSGFSSGHSCAQERLPTRGRIVAYE